eukprot:3125290-Karenia_brevis.AAC.1
MPRFGITSRKEWPNGCNINLYDHGGVDLDWHSDDEEIHVRSSQGSQILSLSLGVDRRFQLKPKSGWPTHDILLRGGDLVAMTGFTQDHYIHRVPVDRGVRGPRISLTWRWIQTNTAVSGEEEEVIEWDADTEVLDWNPD